MLISYVGRRRWFGSCITYLGHSKWYLGQCVWDCALYHVYCADPGYWSTIWEYLEGLTLPNLLTSLPLTYSRYKGHLAAPVIPWIAGLIWLIWLAKWVSSSSFTALLGQRCISRPPSKLSKQSLRVHFTQARLWYFPKKKVGHTPVLEVFIFLYDLM